jgi:hypothetical protein
MDGKLYSTLFLDRIILPMPTGQLFRFPILYICFWLGEHLVRPLFQSFQPVLPQAGKMRAGNLPVLYLIIY